MTSETITPSPTVDRWIPETRDPPSFVTKKLKTVSLCRLVFIFTGSRLKPMLPQHDVLTLTANAAQQHGKLINYPQLEVAEIADCATWLPICNSLEGF